MSPQDIARILLETKAVKLNVTRPFTFASGIKSPIYCDNRHLLGFPEARRNIAQAFAALPLVREADVLAGTSTAGIAWAALAAEILGKPMAYVRAEAKGHGAGKTVEGASVSGKKTAVIEDLISTGGSSKKVWDNLVREGAEVCGLAAIFTYEFKESSGVFQGLRLETLSTFTALIETARGGGFLSEQDCALALQWNASPHTWGL